MKVTEEHKDKLSELLKGKNLLNSWEQGFINFINENNIEFANPEQLSKIDIIYKRYQKIVNRGHKTSESNS